MSNYINNISIWGLMNKNAFINSDTDKLSFYKVKNKSKAVYFEYDPELATKYKQVNFMYMNNVPIGTKGVSSMEQITSVVNKAYFDNETKISNKEYKEVMATVRRYAKLNNIVVKFISENDEDNIIEMIEKWRYMKNGGIKYMWQEHAAIDKACVHKYISDETFRNKTIGLVFYNENICIGYSLVANYVDNENEIKYLTRKVTCINGFRNLTEYIDWLTFKTLWEHLDKPENMYINWGCSSKGVHWYKTHKWIVHSLEPKYFLTVKNRGI